MFIRIFLLKSPFHFGGCKIRLIFLIIKIMAKDFFGKVIDQLCGCVSDGAFSDRLAEKVMPVAEYE